MSEQYKDIINREGGTGHIRWITCKLHNRRVMVGDFKEGGYGVKMKVLLGWRDIRETKFALSDEAAEALHGLLGCSIALRKEAIAKATE